MYQELRTALHTRQNTSRRSKHYGRIHPYKRSTSSDTPTHSQTTWNSMSLSLPPHVLLLFHKLLMFANHLLLSLLAFSNRWIGYTRATISQTMQIFCDAESSLQASLKRHSISAHSPTGTEEEACLQRYFECAVYKRVIFSQLNTSIFYSQNVGCWWTAIRTQKMDPLLRGRNGRAVLGRHQWV